MLRRQVVSPCRELWLPPRARTPRSEAHRTRYCRRAGGELDEIQLLPRPISMHRTEHYLGSSSGFSQPLAIRLELTPASGTGPPQCSIAVIRAVEELRRKQAAVTRRLICSHSECRCCGERSSVRVRLPQCTVALRLTSRRHCGTISGVHARRARHTLQFGSRSYSVITA